MSSRLFILRLAVTLGIGALVSVATACPQSAGPDLAEVDVSGDMTANGLPVKIRQVSSKASAKDVLDRLEKAWRDQNFQVKRHTAGVWEVVAALSDQCMATVQLRDQGSAIGFFAIGKPQTAKRAALFDVGFPLPSGAHVVSDVAARTDERPSRTLVVTSNESVDSLADRFAYSLRDGGWQDVRSHQVAKPNSNESARQITARRGEDRASIVVWSKNQTTAVVSIGQAL